MFKLNITKKCTKWFKEYVQDLLQYIFFTWGITKKDRLLDRVLSQINKQTPNFYYIIGPFNVWLKPCPNSMSKYT